MSHCTNISCLWTFVPWDVLLSYNNLLKMGCFKSKVVSLFQKYFLHKEQECIPVGCVPSACWAYPVGGLPNLPPWMQTIWIYTSWMQTPLDADSPGCRPSWMQTPRCRLPWRQTPLVIWPVMHAVKPTLLWTEWQTGVKTLPCSKLDLRSVFKSGLAFQI